MRWTEPGSAAAPTPSSMSRPVTRRLIPAAWFETGRRSAEPRDRLQEPRTEAIAGDRLGEEWEWEDSPEVTLKIVPTSATRRSTLFNDQSPRFAASLISADAGRT